MSTRKIVLLLAFIVSFPGLPLYDATASQQSEANPTGETTVRSGKYKVTFRAPAEGIYAGEEVELEFRIVDMSTDDPVLGPAGVVRASVDSVITMPAMPGMPKQKEPAHPEGVPGDYGIHPTFPHGGKYLISLTVNPPTGEPFDVDFPIDVKDADPKRPAKPTPFFVELEAKPSKPAAGDPVDLKFTVKDRATNTVVKDFDIAHEKLVHLIIVRDDLGTFNHEHPEKQPDGTFKLRFTFPTEGAFRLFCDTAPRGRGSQVLMAELNVKAGKKGAALKPFTLTESTGSKSLDVDGVRVGVSYGSDSLRTKTDNTLVFTLTNPADGAPITNLQPYLGAMGHLVLINQDAVTYVHSHPDESDENSGRSGVVRFRARFSKPGLYRAWGQFQRDGKIITADFVVRVGESR